LHKSSKVGQKLYCRIGAGRATVPVGGNGAPSASHVMRKDYVNGRDRIARGCATQGVQLLLYRFPLYGHHGRSRVRLHTSPVGTWWSNPAKRLSPSCSANPGLAAFTPSCEVSPNLSPSRPTRALP